METDNQKVEKIIAGVAMENSLRASTVKDVYEKTWKAVRYFMGLETLPRIIIRNFGTLEPNMASIDKQLRKIEERKNEGKDIKDKEKETRFEKAKERIKDESKTRRYSTRKQSQILETSSDVTDVQSVQSEHSDSWVSHEGANQGAEIGRQEGNK